MYLSKVKTRLALLPVLGLLGGGVVFAGRDGPATQPPAVAPVKQPACAGENLPRGAVARLGSPVLRHANASALAFSPDGRKLVSAGAGSEIRIWHTTSGRELWRGRGEGKESLGAAFSADGKTLFTVGGASPGAVCVWDTATGKQLRRFPQPAEYLFGVAFAANRKTAALLLGSNHVRVVDLQTGKERRTLPRVDDLTPLACSPDGALLALYRGTAIELWDLDTGKRRAEFGKLPGQARAYALNFSPDGALLAATAGDGTVRLLDVAAGKELQRLSAGRPGSSLLVAVSSGGVVATASATLSAVEYPAVVRLWDVKGKRLRRLVASRYHVSALAFSADSKTLAATGDEGIIHLWDSTGTPLSFTAGHQAAVTRVLFAPDSKTVVTVGEDRTLRLWDKTGWQLRRWAGWKEGVAGISFSPDGRSLVAALAGGTVFVWDATTGKAKAKIEGRFCAVAPAGRVVALAEEGLLRLCDVATGKEQHRLKLSRAPLAKLLFAPDGHSLLTATQDGSMRIWDPSTGKERSRVEIPAKQRDELLRAHLELSSEGRTLVSLRTLSVKEIAIDRMAYILGYGSVSVWDARTGERLFSLANGLRVFRKCRLSPDGRALVTQDNRSFTIWEVLTGKERRRFPAPRALALALAFSRDGRLFAAGGYDGKVRVWSVDKGKRLAQFEGHDHDVIDVVFSPDGKRLASASGDGTGLVWDVSGLPR